jgi:serine/threonine-protein kinase
VLTLGDTSHYPSSWTPDGKVLTYVTTGDDTGHDIWIKTFGEGETTRPFKQTSWNEQFPEISPDGAWIAYTSDDTGNEEVWVEPFPGPGGRHQVSTNGGEAPAWTKQGAELIYRKENDFFAVAIETRPEFSAGRPQLLFQAPLSGSTPVRGYDVTSDGERFFATRREEIARDDITELEVILNWSQELERR